MKICSYYSSGAIFHHDGCKCNKTRDLEHKNKFEYLTSIKHDGWPTRARMIDIGFDEAIKESIRLEDEIWNKHKLEVG